MSDAIHEIRKVLEHNRDIAFATSDENGNPRVRIFQIMEIGDGELLFATARYKDVFQQLKVNNQVEAAAVNNNVSLRLAGVAFFDVDMAGQRRIFDHSPILQRIYRRYDNPDLIFFRLKIERAEIFDLNSIPPERKYFDMKK